MPDRHLSHRNMLTGLIMKTLALVSENIDDIKGVTLEERAKLVLLTLGRTPDAIRRAYRRLAKKHHPDTADGNTEKFQVINEAYVLLTEGKIPKIPLLMDDQMIIRITGKHVEPLIDRQKEWKKYEKWRRDHFYGVGVV